MLKLSRDHNMYEVYCDDMADSVFVDHRPSKEELEEIRRKKWPGTNHWDLEHELTVYKLAPYYTRV